MKKTLKLLFVVFIFCFCLKLIKTNSGVIEYQIDNFNITVSNNITEINDGTITFPFETKSKIKQIKYYQDDNITCLLPLLSDNNYFSDFLCYQDETYFYYQQITGSNEELDEYVNSLKLDNFYEINESIIINDNIIVYDNIENDSLSIESYKGIYLISNEEIKTTSLFSNDIYSKSIATFINNYYVTADYNEDYEFHYFYVIDLNTSKKTTITSNDAISMYSYIQGIVGNSIYILDPTNKKQYELNIKKKYIIEVGNEQEGIQIYQNNNWTTLNIYKAINQEIYFENTKYQENEYDRVDEIDDKVYVYLENNGKYDAYQILNSYEIYLFTTTDISNIVYSEDKVYYKNGSYLMSYSNSLGNQKIVKYTELEFNSSLHFNVY